LKKAPQKLLLIWAMGVGGDSALGPDEKKSFWFAPGVPGFSSEKGLLSLL
jgi:hypothetical protein